MAEKNQIIVRGAQEHNLKNIDIEIDRGQITVVTGVSGSGKSSLAFDTILAEAHRRFFYTLSHYSRQFLDLGTRPKVRQMQGLSPAIGLAQNETQPSRKATVGTLTDVSELFGVLFARFGEKACPKHGTSIAAMPIDEIVRQLFAEADGKTVMIGAPVAKAKKGHFANQMTRFVKKGYTRALIDGDLVDLDPIPQLVKEEKHDITIVIDAVKIKAGAEKRLERSLATALEESEGYGEYYICGAGGMPNLKSVQAFSSLQGCPTCGFAWPRLDSRYFSVNSLGRCPDCMGYGRTGVSEGEDPDESEEETLDAADVTCATCEGRGLHPDLKAITLQGKSIHHLHDMSLESLRAFVTSELADAARLNPAKQRVLEEIGHAIDRVLAVGLNYLTMSRRILTLSSGEAQRLRLSGVLGENLRGVLYVLDEPSQGLHPSELDRVWESLESLKKSGNTLVLVDHDEKIIKRADWVIDLGPGGGREGGHLLGKFAPKDAQAFAERSVTAKNILRREDVPWKKTDAFRDFISVKKPRLHNLKMDEVKIPLKALTVVTGVSGAGKSSLVQSVLYENVRDALLKKKTKGRRGAWRYCDGITGIESLQAALLIDRRPIAKSVVSMPATYLDVFTELRTFYAKLKEAQIAGLTQKTFSLAQTGGRCEECQGRGEISLNMRFLAAAKVKCPVCRGARYRTPVLNVKYNGLSISDVLNLTLKEACEHFAAFPRIAGKLQPALDLGLGYLKLGQLSAHLSGGESQRLKLATLFQRTRAEGTLVVLDEPTTGLHFEDVMRLMTQLERLVAKGATVIVIEHHSAVIRLADWLIDLGPGSAHFGGTVVYQGEPKGLQGVKESKTALYL